MLKRLLIFGFIMLIFAAVAMLDRSAPIGGKATQAPETCHVDADCVPATCCHANECALRSERPSCTNVVCTAECQPGTLDCGKLQCGCVVGKCVTRLF